MSWCAGMAFSGLEGMCCVRCCARPVWCACCATCAAHLRTPDALSSDRRGMLRGAHGGEAPGERKPTPALFTQHTFSTDNNGEGAMPDWIKGMVDVNNEIERIFGIDLDGDGGVGTSAALQHNLDQARRSMTLSNANEGQVPCAYALMTAAAFPLVEVETREC